MKRWILIVAGVLLAAGLSLCAAAWWAMRQPPAVFGGIVARTPMWVMMAVPFETLWTRARAGRLQPGDAAPDFLLPTLDRASAVQLSGLRGRPVVLVFGSYT